MVVNWKGKREGNVLELKKSVFPLTVHPFLLFLIFVFILILSGHFQVGQALPFPTKGATALETDFVISNKTLSKDDIVPGEAVKFNFTIENTGEREEYYRIKIIQDYDWQLLISSVMKENGSEVNYSRNGQIIEFLNVTFPGEKIYFVGFLSAPNFKNDFNFTKREVIEKLGIYANRNVSLTLRVMASSDNYATKKDAVFKVKVLEYHSLICQSDSFEGYLNRESLQKTYFIRVTHISNLFEGEKTAGVTLTLSKSPTPEEWNASLSKKHFTLALGETKEIELFINATEDSLVLDDPYYFEAWVTFWENLSNTGRVLSFKTMVQQEGRFEFVVNKTDLTKTSIPGRNVSFVFGIKNTGLGPDVVNLYTSSEIPFWSDIRLKSSLLMPGETEYKSFSIYIPENTTLRAGDTLQLHLTGYSSSSPFFTETLLLTVEIDMFFGFQFEKEEYNGYASPDDPARYLITLTSKANIIQNISFTILPDVVYYQDGKYINTTLSNTDWYGVVSPKSLLIEPGESAAIELTVGTLSSGSPEDYLQISLKGVVENIPVGSPFYPFELMINITTTMKPYHALSLNFSENRRVVAASTEIDIPFSLKNKGNVEEVVTLSGICDWSFYISSTHLKLQPHEEKNMSVRVYIPRERKGVETYLTIMAEGEEKTVVTSDTMTLVIGSSYGVEISVPEVYSLLRGVPGERLPFFLNLTNIGNQRDIFHLDSSSPHVDFSSKEVELDAFKSTTVAGTVTIPDTPASGIEFETIYKLNISATSRKDSTKSDTTEIRFEPLIIGVKPPTNPADSYYQVQSTTGAGRIVAEVEGYSLRGNEVRYLIQLVNINTEASEFKIEVTPEMYPGVSFRLEGMGLQFDPVLGVYSLNLSSFEKREISFVVETHRDVPGRSYLFSVKARYDKGYETVKFTTIIPSLDLWVSALKLKTESFEGKETKASLTIVALGSKTGVSGIDTISDMVIELRVEDGEPKIYHISSIKKGESLSIDVSWETPKMSWLYKEKKYRVSVNIREFYTYQSKGEDDKPGNNYKEFTVKAKDSSIVAVLPYSSYTSVYIGLTILSFFVLFLFLFKLNKTVKKRFVRYPFYPFYLLILSIFFGLVYTLPIDGTTYALLVAFFGYLVFLFTSLVFSFRARHLYTSIINGILPYAVFVFMVTGGATFSQFFEVFFTEVFYIDLPFFTGVLKDVPVSHLFILALSTLLNLVGYYIAHLRWKNALRHIALMQARLNILKGEELDRV